MRNRTNHELKPDDVSEEHGEEFLEHKNLEGWRNILICLNYKGVRCLGQGLLILAEGAELSNIVKTGSYEPF